MARNKGVCNSNMKLGNLKSLKPRVFKFKEGQIWDGVEDIFDYIEELLVVSY